MCYIILTCGSVVWFVLSLIADMLVAVAMLTPRWLIAPSPPIQADILNTSPHTLVTEAQEPFLHTPHLPSVGINTRCKYIHGRTFHCGLFDLDGFATDSLIYPDEWKAAMFFIALGFSILTLTVALTLITCCRQSCFGKSLHNMTACAQVLAGIFVILALFLHPLGWASNRVKLLCGADAESFYPAACSIGFSFYCGVAGVVLCFCCAGVSLQAESANMRSNVKRRIEGGERLVCIP